jgi:hypothetical protein
MDRTLLALVAVVACHAALAQDAPAPRVAGTVELVEGLARVEGKDRRVRTPAAGQTVLEGDTISTLSDSEVQLQMADGALFIVRERTRVTITEYVADGGSGDRSLMDLAEGALRAITGWIGNYNRNSYRIRTPLVTIGVRGTDHEPSHIPIGDPRGEPGSYDKVNEGAAFMETKQGIVEVPKSRVVFHSASAKGAPRFLDRAPRFYRPGRHEQRFVARAQEVRRTIPQRRFERQEFVRQHGAKAGATAPQRAAPGRPLPQDGAPRTRPAGKSSAPKARNDGEVRAVKKPQRPEHDERPKGGKAQRHAEGKR